MRTTVDLKGYKYSIIRYNRKNKKNKLLEYFQYLQE